MDVGRRNALSRLAYVFCEMAIRCEEADHGDWTSFPLPITQSDLGDATGLMGVHVNRTLRDLRTAGIVELRAGIVTIHNWEKLVSIGDFDAAFMLLGGPTPRIAEAT